MEPTSPISITLQMQEWQQAIEILMNGPWRAANPLIQKIMEQAQQAQQAEALAGAPGLAPGPAPNGQLGPPGSINSLSGG
jgi:hypothetical protein